MGWAGELVFVACAVLAVFGAVATVAARSPLRAAMALLVNIVAIAGLFLTLRGHLLSVLQLLVYAGAVVVLFIFVIMMIGPSAQPVRSRTARTRGLAVRTLAFGMMALGTVAIAAVLGEQAMDWPSVPPAFGTVEAFGRELYQNDVIPFELIGVLLLVAIIGAIAVARGRSPEEAALSDARKKEEAEKVAKRREEEQRLAAEVAAHGGGH